jgi:hypothetical protein
MKCALPGREEAESRRAADTAAEASWRRSHASGAGSGGGLGGGGRWRWTGGWGAGYGGDVGRVDRQWSGWERGAVMHVDSALGRGLREAGPCFLGEAGCCFASVALIPNGAAEVRGGSGVGPGVGPGVVPGVRS